MNTVRNCFKYCFNFKLFFKIIILNLIVALPISASAAELLKPFYLAKSSAGVLQEQAVTTKKLLTNAGFSVVGEYSPYSSVVVLIITNDELKAAAKKTPYGIFGVIQRVTLTQVNKNVQISYSNPTYFSHAYRMGSDLAGVTALLQKTLGMKQAYGSEKGVSVEDLRDYQYKWLMPYFYDRLRLAEYKNYDEAIAGVEQALAKGKGQTAKIARVDLKDSKTTLFAVQLKGNSDTTECSGDNYIMQRVDFKELHSTGHLPYEMVVVGNNVYALPAEFRIAISFPDLSMMGSNSFASIMCAPTAIETALTLAAGGQLSED
ncbi:MAG: hypothetical protein ACC653_08000 [Gammaproteobacteria bacterium]